MQWTARRLRSKTEHICQLRELAPAPPWPATTMRRIRYAGFSTCFWKEAGSHRRDTAGILRVHQFEKIEQFCATSPNDNESWEMHEEMIKNSEVFYKEIGLPYQVVSVVSGALNDAAAKRLLGKEAWNRLLPERDQSPISHHHVCMFKSQNDEQSKQFIHMLNSMLTATERTLCCILVNYQKEDGVAVPKVLQGFMCGIYFLPFKWRLDRKQAGDSKPKSIPKEIQLELQEWRTETLLASGGS